MPAARSSRSMACGPPPRLGMAASAAAVPPAPQLLLLLQTASLVILNLAAADPTIATAVGVDPLWLRYPRVAHRPTLLGYREALGGGVSVAAADGA
eukprot:SAG31_NODE_6641_length_1942_cov_1.368964_3_plen_95_part_01